MKKCVCLLLAAVLLLTAGCALAAEPERSPVISEEPMPVPDSEPAAVVDIVDRTETEFLATDDALEGFWRDEEYTYSFASIKSHYIIVHYSDGTQLPIREAMARGDVTIADLDRYGIAYIRVEKEK